MNESFAEAVPEKKAVVLLSGGLDSATSLYWATNQGYTCHCLSFDYGQRHKKELKLAQRLAQRAGCSWQLVKCSLPWKGSALLDKSQSLPEEDRPVKQDIPSTYVPGRNIIFLSFALSCAEALGAQVIIIGANQIDYSGYPDCRQQFLDAFSRAAALGTACGTSGKPVHILAPLVHRTKVAIIQLAQQLQVPLELTWSCYRGGKKPCGRCDSCCFRREGFRQAGIADPALC